MLWKNLIIFSIVCGSFFVTLGIIAFNDYVENFNRTYWNLVRVPYGDDYYEKCEIEPFGEPFNCKVETPPWREDP